MINEADPEKKNDIQRVWIKASREMAKSPKKWQRVNGPRKATIATVLDLRWAPISPAKWLTEDRKVGCDIGSSHGQDIDEIVYHVQNNLEEQMWTEAAKSYNGGGLERGLPMLEGAAKARDYYLRKGEVKLASAVEAIAESNTWTAQRLTECGIRTHSGTNICQRCDLGVVHTHRHRY